MQIKKVIAGFAVTAALLGGTQIIAPNMAEATQSIDLGYGESRYSGSHWHVQPGSIQKYYAPNRSRIMELHVTVILADQYCDLESRTYVFTNVFDEGWQFTWSGYTGKSGKIKSGSPRSVSGNKLANDILYVALH